MAGAGAYLWEAGEVVTAANLNQYVQDQVVAVYANSTARDAAYGGAGEPTVAEGMLCFLKDSDTLQYYNGSSWVNFIVPVTFNAKGDLLTASADDTPAILSVGTNDHVLTADSTAPNGIKWAAVSTPSTDFSDDQNILAVSVFS